MVSLARDHDLPLDGLLDFPIHGVSTLISLSMSLSRGTVSFETMLLGRCLYTSEYTLSLHFFLSFQVFIAFQNHTFFQQGQRNVYLSRLPSFETRSVSSSGSLDSTMRGEGKKVTLENRITGWRRESVTARNYRGRSRTRNLSGFRDGSCADLSA